MEKIIQWCERMKALGNDYEECFYQALCNSACYQHYLYEIESSEGTEAADKQHLYHSLAAKDAAEMAFTPKELETIKSIRIKAN